MSKEKTNELYVAIATQKGGIGKSTITMLLANYLHNLGGKNVGVVDCDDPQHSISDARERELLLIKNNEADKEAAKDVFRKTGKRIFPVVATNPVDALDQAEILIEDENLDIVLFDLPGTIRSKGVLSTLSQMDYIFVPISADRLVLESALQFVANFKDNLMTTGKAVTKEICLFWTMVDGREKTDIYNLYDEVIGDLGISVLNTRIPDSKRFRRDFSEPEKAVFRSTIFLPDQHLLRGSRIKAFCFCSVHLHLRIPFGGGHFSDPHPQGRGEKTIRPAGVSAAFGLPYPLGDASFDPANGGCWNTVQVVA